MPKNIEIQDLDEMARQMDAALAEARQMMENLPEQIEGMDEATDTLPALAEKLLSEMEESGEIRDAGVQGLIESRIYVNHVPVPGSQKREA